jgi:predicted enzyme related to lactoylglutathione lyase
MNSTLGAAPILSIWSETPSRRRNETNFYTQLFGWTTTNVDMGPMGTYAMFQQSSPNVGGIVRVESPEWDGLPPHWAVYVQVDNVDARARRAQELGGTICIAPFDIPNVGRACVVLDPEGASFYLFTPKTPR